MPSTIAILGASADRTKFGNKAVRAYLAEGWTVYPVNRNGGAIEGLDAVTSLAQIDVDLDRISVYLPPPVTLESLPEIAAAGAAEVWLNPGSADSAVMTTATDLGVPIRPACSIVDIGRSPSEFS